MPNITAVGTYTEDSPGFGFLAPAYGTRTILLAGSTLPSTLQIQYEDDEGVARTFEGGLITSLPTSIVLSPNTRPLIIKVTGGSPNFNVCEG